MVSVPTTEIDTKHRAAAAFRSILRGTPRELWSHTFHPDRHCARAEAEREGLYAIFKRGTEAHLVLSDAARRGQYDAQLAVRGVDPPPRVTFAPVSRPPPGQSSGMPSIDDLVHSPGARPFARRADELLRRGDLRQAKLQLVMANHMDPDNEALAAALRDLEAKLGRTP